MSKDWGMEKLRRIGEQRARADAFFARSYVEVMSDIGAVVTPAMRAKGSTPTTKAEEPAPIVDMTNVVSFTVFKARRMRGH